MARRTIKSVLAGMAAIATGVVLAIAAPTAASAMPYPAVVVGAPTGSGVTDGVVTGDGAVTVPVTVSGFGDAANLVAVVSLPDGGGSIAVDQSGLGSSIQKEYGYSAWSGLSKIAFHGTRADVTAALAANLRWTAPMSGSPVALTVAVSEYADGTFYNPANGHYYKTGTTTPSITATAAATAAAGTTLFGMTGYLATITSKAENDFTASYVNAQNVWIGASDAATEGTWRWIAGPEAGTAFWQGTANGARVGGAFTSWTPGEPNDSGGNEDYAGTNYNGVPGKWNDFPNGQSLQNYLIEYGGLPGQTSSARSAVATGTLTASAPIMTGTLDGGGDFTAGTVVAPTGSAPTAVAVELQRFGSTTSNFTATVSVPTGGGTLSVTPTTGLTLAYGYSSFTGQRAIGFTGSFANVRAALRTGILWTPPTAGTALTLSASVAEQVSGAYFNPGNGHYYLPKSASGSTSWTSAKTQAQASTLGGMTGYLATITSAAENTFTAQYINASNLWIGASDRYSEINQVADQQYAQQSASEGKWFWVTGPEAGSQFWQGAGNGQTLSGQYASWNTNEPNNTSRCTASHQAGNWFSGYYTVCDNTTDGEHYIATNYNGQAGKWNDFDVDNGVSGWLVEFGGMPNQVSTLKSALGEGQLVAGTVPTAPASVSALAGETTVNLSWTPPSSDGLSAITGYTVTSTPVSAGCSTSTSSGTGTACTIPGLTPGTQYTFTVTAQNALGSSPASAASNSVAPIAVTLPPTPPTANAGSSDPVVVPIDVGQQDVPVAVDPALAGSAPVTATVQIPASDGVLSFDIAALHGATVAPFANGGGWSLTGTLDQIAAALQDAVTWNRADGVHGTDIEYAVYGDDSLDAIADGSPSQPLPIAADIAGTGVVTATVLLSPGNGRLDIPADVGGTTTTVSDDGTIVTIIGTADAVKAALAEQITWSPGNSNDPTPVGVEWLLDATGTHPVTVEEVAAIPVGPATTVLTLPEDSGRLTFAEADLPTDVTAVVSDDGRTLTLTGPAEGVADAMASAVRWMAPATSGERSITAEVTGADGYATTFEVPVLAVGAPGSPIEVGGVQSGTDVVVSWSPPTFDGGSAIVGYTATLDGTSSSCAAEVDDLSCTIPEIDAEDGPFTVSVVARNAGGPSAAASGPVTPTMPGSPTGVTALPGGSGATVTWTAPEADGGSAVTSYLVTATSTDAGAPMGRTCTAVAPATSCAVSALTSAAPFVFSYDFTVVARNAVGSSPAASTSAPVTVTAATPGQVTGVETVQQGSVAHVSWNPPADDGGAPITGYHVIDTASGLECLVNAPATSCDIPGLVAGHTYAFVVTAANGIGTGPSRSAEPTLAGAISTEATPVVASGEVTALPIVLDTRPFDIDAAATVHLSLDGPGGVLTVPDADSDGHVDTAPEVTVTGNGTAEVVLSGPLGDVADVLADDVAWTGPDSEGSYGVTVEVAGVDDNGAGVHTSALLPLTVRTAPSDTALPPVPPTSELAPGEATLVVDGASTPVTVGPETSGKGIVLTGAGFDLHLSALDAAGSPLPLDANGDVVITAGMRGRVTGSGFLPESTVQLYLFSSPTPLGSLSTSSSGALDGTFTIPLDATIGRHTLQVSGFTTAGLVRTASVGVVVAAASGAVVTAVAETAAASAPGVLASTGVPVVPYLGGILLLLAAGCALLVGARVRRARRG